MVSDGNMIVSSEALTRLRDALLRFHARTSTTVSDVAGDLSRRLYRLEAVREDAQQDVRHCQRYLSACDDNDDRGHAQSELDAAEERLRRINQRIGQIVDAFSQFKRANQGAQELIGSRLPHAVSYLEIKLALLAEYINVQMPEPITGQGYTTATGLPLVGAALPNQSDNGIDLSDAPLPSGFQWVRLDSISRSDDLRPEETFHKVSSPDVHAGFTLLRDVVLPALEEDPTRSGDYFYDLDRMAGRNHDENGAKKVYDVFFGDTSVTLHQGYGDGKYGVHDGRHRIHAARDIGWVAIPAKIAITHKSEI